MGLTIGQIRALSHGDLLSKIAEEASEVIKASMKFAIHGHRPEARGVRYDNLKDVLDEYEQLSAFVRELRSRYNA